VAVKLHRLPADRRQSRQLLDRAQLVASIHSQRVVQVYDVIASRDYLALIMEYVPGCDLEELLRAVRPDIASVLSIAAEVASALAAARQRKVVHGDLKPANLLLTLGGHVKLTDFGIARPIGTHAGGVGSLACLSPEQYRQEPLDVRSDLFALGCLLYRMISGAQPFVRNGHFDSELLLHEDPVPLAERWDRAEALPPRLLELIMILLQKRPEDRPPNTHQVRQSLRDVMHDLPPQVDNPVLKLARPYLKSQLTAVQPPRLPDSLGREGRSQLHGVGQLHRLRQLWRFGELWQRVLLVAGSAFAAILLLTVLIFAVSGDKRIQLQAIQVNATGQSAGIVSAVWLSSELETILSRRLQDGERLLTDNSPAPPVLYREGRTPLESPPDETLHLEVNCSDEVCILDFIRDRGGHALRAQAMLLADALNSRWQEELQYLVEAVYPSGRAALVSGGGGGQ
jgi:hypothetical protein